MENEALTKADEKAEDESLARINRFLLQHGASTDTISKSRVKQFLKVDSAIQSRLKDIDTAQKTLKGRSITVTSISGDTKIARKTFYNNDLLRLYVESYSDTYEDKMVLQSEYERLKAKYEEDERQIKGFLLRDIETENLRQEIKQLQSEIRNLEKRNSSLETQYEKIQKENIELKKRVPPNIVEFKPNTGY